MAGLSHIAFGILILQLNVYAAPSDVSKVEEIAKVQQAETEPKLDEIPKENATVESDSNSTETQRQKRWYNPYGFPPINPLIYPSYNKRDEGLNTGYYGGIDPLVQIHRQIQEIANIVRQPPPPPPHFPIFYPVLFIPPGDCNCNPNPAPTPQPEPDPVPSFDDTPENDTTPSVMNRWPVMEDERQNWGFVLNDTDSEEGIDFSRPISFDPIKLNRPGRPPPPVDHGSVQSNSMNKDQPQTEPPRAQTTRRPPSQNFPSAPPQDYPTAPAQNYPAGSSQFRPPSGLPPPSRCDGAILTCCHQPQVIYDCFAIQGCPDFSAYGNPCDANLILRVIERFQTYYGQKG